jgi:hypothetical protein
MAGGANRVRRLLMAGRRPSRRRPAPAAPDGELEQLDGIVWPQLRASWAGRTEEEISAAHRRAAQLVEGGHGSIRW